MQFRRVRFPGGLATHHARYPLSRCRIFYPSSQVSEINKFLLSLQAQPKQPPIYSRGGRMWRRRMWCLVWHNGSTQHYVIRSYMRRNDMIRHYKVSCVDMRWVTWHALCTHAMLYMMYDMLCVTQDPPHMTDYVWHVIHVSSVWYSTIRHAIHDHITHIVHVSYDWYILVLYTCIYIYIYIYIYDTC